MLVAWSGLLEVNLSPALRHSSKHQSTIIRSMCEGLLRLTVDHIFPTPQSSTSNVDVDDESLDSDTPTSFDTPEPAGGSEDQANQVHLFGKWRLITTPTPSGWKTEHSETPSASLDGNPITDTRVGAINASAQVFSLRGRHLTRRSLARVERGVREATAVKMLVTWWRSTAEERRIMRLRKMRAIAEISKWVVKVIARQRALWAISERSATAIQKLWRRASARMSEARNLASACIIVQTMWRRWQLNQRCSSRRLQRKVSSRFQTWARALLFRRRKARKSILREVILLRTRQKRERHTIAVIVRALKMACNRRRRSRLQLQRFARIPCLLKVRLAALCSARVACVCSKAATIVARAIRRNAAQSFTVRVTLAARTLQCWCRRILRKWKARVAATLMVQRAWRQAKRRRIRVSEKLRCMVDAHFHGFSLAVAGASPLETSVKAAAAAELLTNAPVCAVALGKVTSTSAGVPVLDASGSRILGAYFPRSQVNGIIKPGDSPSPRCSTPTYSTAEEHVTGSLPVPADGEYETSPSFSNEMLSSATTTCEGSTDPDLCLADGGIQSCHSHSSGDCVLSCNEGYCKTVVPTRRPGSYSGTATSYQRSNQCADGVKDGQRPRPLTPRTVDPKKGQPRATHERSGAILSLEDILPYLKRRRQDPFLKGKRRGRSEGLRQQKPARHMPKRGNKLQGLGDTPTTTSDYCSDAGFPYPPAGGAQPINTRSPCGMRRLTRALGKVDTGIKLASHDFSGINHRGKAAGNTDCASPPSSLGFRVAPLGDAHNTPSIGRNCTRAGKTTSRFASAKRHSRQGPTSSSARTTGNAKRGVGAAGVGHGSTMFRGRGSNIQCKGGVLEMLAFMEA